MQDVCEHWGGELEGPLGLAGRERPHVKKKTKMAPEAGHLKFSCGFHTHTCVESYTFIYTFIHTYTFIPAVTHTYAHTHAVTCTCADSHGQTHVQSQEHRCMFVCMCTHKPQLAVLGLEARVSS